MSRCELSTGQLADVRVPITSGTTISSQWALTTLRANRSRARAASPEGMKARIQPASRQRPSRPGSRR